LKTPLIVPIENLKEEPYGSVLCYPRVSETELQNRLGELQKLGVKAVEFAGKTNAFNLPVLGKGYVGVVIIAHLDGHRAALKVRRVDADRLGLQHEAQMLAKANSVGVGPTLMSVSNNFLLMQFIDGTLLPDWLETSKEKGRVHSVLSEVLEQCWRLDAIGLDHGELSHAPKHLIVAKDEQPFIVDFETASVKRKPANVTSICQFLFISSGVVTRTVAETLGEKSAEEIVSVLRIYKNHRTRENFDRVLQTCLP
jgi:putative serine/threonine protein kinase